MNAYCGWSTVTTNFDILPHLSLMKKTCKESKTQEIKQLTIFLWIRADSEMSTSKSFLEQHQIVNDKIVNQE